MYTEKDLTCIRTMLMQKSNLNAVTSADCEQISIAVFLSTDGYISTSTIKRLFGVIPSYNPPPKAILDILSQYLGFQDWDQFDSFQQENPL